MKQRDDIAIADMIVMAAQHSRKAREREELAPIARAVANVKHFRYDEQLIKAVDRTRSIDAEEIIGNLKSDYLPFDQLWIYGPPVPMGTKSTHPLTIQMGMLVQIHQSGTGFEIKVFELEKDAEETKEAYRRRNRDFQGYIYNNKTMGEVYSSITTVVDSKKGIALDEDNLLIAMEAIENFRKNMSRQGPIMSNDKFHDITDLYYYTADFLARTFVLLGSGAEDIRVNWKKTPDDLQAEKKVRARIRMGADPRFTAEPITIDLTKINSDLSKPNEPAAIRDLPGWTAVRRSKEIVSKNGKVFTRAPHDRRIAALVDRRNVERVLTNSNADLTLAIGPAGPKRILGQLQQ